MSAYTQVRAMRISFGMLPSEMTVKPIINNTGHSRQVRRANERRFDRAELSIYLIGKLALKHEGQGFFFRNGRPVYPGWPNERRTSSRDYSKRYAALFPVLPDASDDQGRHGSGMAET